MIPRRTLLAAGPLALAACGRCSPSLRCCTRTSFAVFEANCVAKAVRLGCELGKGHFFHAAQAEWLL
jgi:hypothetical protein